MTGLWLWLALACGGAGDVAPGPGGVEASAAGQPPRFERRTQSGHYTLKVRFDPEVPRIGELFSVIAEVTDAKGEPVEAGEVVMNARMPQHNHGMETDPVADAGTCEGEGDARACTHPGGMFRSDGFKFHMGGEWTLTFEVRGSRGVDTTSFVYEIL